MSLGICRHYESDGPSTRVLVVDADREATSTLAGMLGDLGCDVSYAFDARLALLYGRKCRAQVAFFDLGTPHITGLRLTQAFRNESMLAGCGLIALSGHPNKTGGDGSRQLGFDAFLAKPVGLPQLEAALQPFVSPLSNATVPLPATATRA